MAGLMKYDEAFGGLFEFRCPECGAVADWGGMGQYPFPHRKDCRKPEVTCVYGNRIIIRTFLHAMGFDISSPHFFPLSFLSARKSFPGIFTKFWKSFEPEIRERREKIRKRWLEGRMRRVAAQNAAVAAAKAAARPKKPRPAVQLGLPLLLIPQDEPQPVRKPVEIEGKYRSVRSVWIPPEKRRRFDPALRRAAVAKAEGGRPVKKPAASTGFTHASEVIPYALGIKGGAR